MKGIATLALLACLVTLSGCKRPWKWPGTEPGSPTPSVTPKPTATPQPTPIYIPQKRIEISRLFNEMQVRTELDSEEGSTATLERETPSSYAVEVRVKVKVPKPNRDLASLSKLNPALPKVLPCLAEMLEEARVPSQYEALYGRKLAQLQRNLPKLDALLTRHNFFDCETMLELRHPKTKRTALLVQADMDVDTDGSDPDRLPAADASDATFQPMTSYMWPKRTGLVNPFLAGRMARLHAVEAELARSKHLGAPRVQALRDAVNAARYEVTKLKTCSFLIAETDPYVVVPGIFTDGMDPSFRPRVGDYCAVIHGNLIYPAIVGDVGPRDVVGEASYRIGKEINSETTGAHRAESNLKVTYLYFPNTADKPFGPPDLAKYRARVEELLNELGGYGGLLHTWVELSRPAPTPTPPPTPTPSPMPSPVIPIPALSGTSGSTPVILLPAPTPTPNITQPGTPPAPVPSKTPVPTPSATPG